MIYETGYTNYSNLIYNTSYILHLFSFLARLIDEQIELVHFFDQNQL
ncbi:hypothetical protein SAMN05216167_105284 [Spirosoma endophyticum]|uniref:Uncharacterized protein n=1 Tax=Spirosoma endophyticum TaxID=662367 RepID=A0A1I1T5M4_9BACT|nr:hypothetical protein SAMN05216167_105284 [Spirosoma endophyticum]